jgi:hypothetical protein
MNAQELEHLHALLSSSGPIPEPSRVKLLGMVEIARSNVAANERKAERDQIIRDGAESLGLPSIKARARLLAEQSKRLHRGGRSAYPWITRADRIDPLPESPRRFEQILGE